ncbi:multicopper oxidase domain-containing protein [Pannonibacter sp. Pt2]|uniref:Multicopper oxidase domain-containing protein n=1 Tax=Pannonibacter anstelovis TaxID=3121537 RepID=A0ABU7ZTX9_9HYPH
MITTRRALLQGGAALAACAMLPASPILAATQTGTSSLSLRAVKRTLEVKGRAATVLGLEGPSGPGLTLDAGQRFQVNLTNGLDEPTLIHWHGQIPPNEQDGVPDMPLPALQPGENRAYDFAPRTGTFWMHSHIPFQEMQLLAAPLIVRSAAEMQEDRQDVVMLLHDFSFKSPEEVMAAIGAGHGGGHGGANGHGHGHGGHGAAAAGHSAHAGHAAANGQGGMDMSGAQMAGMDLNDHDWDAYLANDRTLDDPQVVQVEKGGRVRLRIINASAATVFWIETGALAGQLTAVDGDPVQPLAGSRFGIAMGQRLDIELDLPATAGNWPILARREGAREQTGLILATAGASVSKLPDMTDTPAPAFDTDLSQESRLRAAHPLPQRPADRQMMVMLGGTMQPYVWTINGAVWGEHQPLEAVSGERVEITFHNMSMMGHPMHLHGHVFQVVAVNGQRLSGALRDTVYVPPMAMVTVALDAGEAARWMLHCHHMPHLVTGMMTEFQIRT